MAGRYVSTKTSIYTDPDLRGWAVTSIYFYRYLYENDHVHGLSGVGRIAPDIMEIETRLTPEQIEQAKVDMGNRVMWFDDGTYWVVARSKHTCFTNDGKVREKYAKSVVSYLSECSSQVQIAYSIMYPSIMPNACLCNGTTHRTCGNPTLPTEAVAVNESEAVAESENEAVDSSSLSIPKLVGAAKSIAICMNVEPNITKAIQGKLAEGYTLDDVYTAIKKHENLKQEWIQDILKDCKKPTVYNDLGPME